MLFFRLDFLALDRFAPDRLALDRFAEVRFADFLAVARLAPDFLVPDFVPDFVPERLRVAAAFLADFDREAFERFADEAPPFFAPLRLEALLVVFPRPDPLRFPPPVSLFTVAQARRSASLSGTPRLS